ncbi:hypothetical protein NKG94_41390 [Micromonospora sp. M12]
MEPCPTTPPRTPPHRPAQPSILLAASAGAAAAIGAAGLPVLATGTPALANPGNASKLRVEPLIPAKNRGIILYSVRDRITAAPDDSGVPYGFERVLARLAEIGYKEIEFAGYTQSTEILGRQITPPRSARSWTTTAWWPTAPTPRSSRPPSSNSWTSPRNSA